MFDLEVEIQLVGQETLDLWNPKGVRVKGKSPDQGYYILVSGKEHPGEGNKRGSKGSDVKKNADEDLEPDFHWRWYPNIIIEIGFSKSYADLIMDTRFWLLSSPGHPVLSFILFKFHKPDKEEDFEDFEKWSLFFKVWEK